jgi:phosphoribosylglycinamide formyltransferase-1
VTSKLDDGPVLGQLEVSVRLDDTADTLATRVQMAEHQLYPRILSEYVERHTNPEYLIAQVRIRALAQPESDEVLSHGMPCFGIIGGKKFAYVSVDHHGDGKIALLVKISGIEEQSMLIDSDAERYYRPAYFGDGWVGIRLDLGDTDWDHIGDWIGKSLRAVAPKKLTKFLDLIGE